MSETCPECNGTGTILTCCDDICHGIGYCIHGDGEETCPVCWGDGEVDSDGEFEEDTYSQEYDENLAWLCGCGNYQQNGGHCSTCGRQPPWGCDCSDCTDRAEEEYYQDHPEEDDRYYTDPFEETP